MKRLEAMEKLKNGSSLRELPKSFRDDKEIVMFSIRCHSYYYNHYDCYEFEYASKRLKDDYKTVCEIGSIEYASERLKDDADFICNLMREAKDKVNPELENFVGYNVRYVSDRLKNDTEFLMSAIKIDWHALCCIPNPTREMIMEAIKQDPEAILYADSITQQVITQYNLDSETRPGYMYLASYHKIHMVEYGDGYDGGWVDEGETYNITIADTEEEAYDQLRKTLDSDHNYNYLMYCGENDDIKTFRRKVKDSCVFDNVVGYIEKIKVIK